MNLNKVFPITVGYMFNWYKWHKPIIPDLISYTRFSISLPSGNLLQFAIENTTCIVDLPIQNGDFPSFLLYVYQILPGPG